MRKIVLFLSVLSAITCSCSITKNIKTTKRYVSICDMTGFPILTSYFYANHTFLYDYGFTDEFNITGKWEIKKDSLFLYSKIFEGETISFDEWLEFMRLNPDSISSSKRINRQYTKAKNKDCYIIRGIYLYPLSRDGHTKQCCLIKRKINPKYDKFELPPRSWTVN